MVQRIDRVDSFSSNSNGNRINATQRKAQESLNSKESVRSEAVKQQDRIVQERVNHDFSLMDYNMEKGVSFLF